MSVCGCVSVCLILCRHADVCPYPCISLPFEGGDDDAASVAALGRPFKLGDLYNLETNEIIIGKGLFLQEKLEDNNAMRTPTHRTTVRVPGRNSTYRERTDGWAKPLNFFYIPVLS